MSRFIILFAIGGIGYCTLEILWRGYTHWTMLILGGVCFYLLFYVFHYMENTNVFTKAIIGGSIITAAEFLTGCIVNIALKWDVWNYASAPYNLLGQICLPYYVLWILLCIPISFLDKLIGQYI